MSSAPFVTDGFWFGGDYNPEQWPREVWREDVELMQRAGVTTATVGVFSWALLEPEEGGYEFGWLDDVLAMLHEGGIGVVLATPTASPPPWFSLAHPDALTVRDDGVQRWHGSRDTYCPSAPAYREASRRIARALAERYGDHPALRAWHVHNEYGTICWCDHVARAFRAWLQARYGSLDALNDAWYTAFWSQHYSAWEQIVPPRDTQYLHNPTHAVDFRRFISDEYLDCLREQRAEIQASGSRAPVTTNLMLPTWNNLEQWSWAEELDVVAVDHYLDTTAPDGETHVAYGSDLTRSWAGGQPWLLMEQSANTISLDGRIAYKEPGRMLRNSLSYIAHGSQGALFFQWRASAAGSEAWHGAIVPHAGADSTSFRGACELGATLRAIGEVAAPPADGRVLDADVAILWHADGWWALENRSLPSDHLDFSAAVRSTHRALWHAGVAVDFARPGTDLSAYKLVLVPSMFTLNDAAVRALEDYVAGGGQLAVWYFSGVADENLHVVTGGYPGRLRDLLGVRVESFRPLGVDEHVELSDGLQGARWSELVHLEGARALATYVGGPLNGRPAVTAAERGPGTAYYVSTELDPASTATLLDRLMAQAGVMPVLGATPPAGVEAVRRRGAEHDYLFVLNHGATDITVRGEGYDLVGDRQTAEGVLVPGGGYLVARESTAPQWTVTVDEGAGGSR
ncbi:MAG TPA: beta-galactosidase [Propionibacteriaceae bacterium]